MKLNEIVKRAHEWTVKKGYWDAHDNTEMHYKFTLMARCLWNSSGSFLFRNSLQSDKLRHHPYWAEKLADVIIMAASFLHAFGVDVDQIVREKMDYNDTRDDK